MIILKIPSTMSSLLHRGSRRRRMLGMDSVMLAVVMLLIAAACGGGGSDDAAGDGETATGVTDDDVVTDAGHAGDASSDDSLGADSGFDSSDELKQKRLVDYIGITVVGSDPGRARAFYTRQEQKVQDLIAKCMATGPFEYIPAVRPSTDSTEDRMDSDERYAREQGFGISTQFDLFEDIDDASRSSDVAEWTNPNQEIVEALAVAERQAYNDMLYGVVDDDPDLGGGETEGEATDDLSTGCMNQAYEKVYSAIDDISSQLDLASLITKATADPRTQDAYEQWSQCMSAKGHEYRHPDNMYEEVYTDLQSRYEEIVSQQDGQGVFDDGEFFEQEDVEAQVGDVEAQVGDVEAQVGDVEAQTGDDQDTALAELQAEERAIALANFECSKDLNEQLNNISAGHEAEFIMENSDVFVSLQD